MTALRSGSVDTEVRLLAALADPVRLDMLRQLARDGEVCGCGFRVRERVAQPTVSHHLRVLREAGLVRFSYLRYRLDPEALAGAAEIVDGLRHDPGALTDEGLTREAPTACCGVSRSKGPPSDRLHSTR